MRMPRCVFCGQEVLSPATAYRKVTGWERKRDGGGTNALALREPHDEFAHVSCVDRAKVHVPGQEQMFT
jgi:hypothetical protein